MKAYAIVAHVVQGVFAHPVFGPYLRSITGDRYVDPDVVQLVDARRVAETDFIEFVEELCSVMDEGLVLISTRFHPSKLSLGLKYTLPVQRGCVVAVICEEHYDSLLQLLTIDTVNGIFDESLN